MSRLRGKNKKRNGRRIKIHCTFFHHADLVMDFFVLSSFQFIHTEDNNNQQQQQNGRYEHID